MARHRGFSLVELIVVVVIIAVLAVIAIPKITRRVKDRRTQQAAHEVSILYRNARLRALGHGAAVLVRFSDDNGGSFTAIEAVRQGDTCTQLPETSCTLTSWSEEDESIALRTITSFGPANAPNSEGITLQVAIGTSPLPDLDICFTPMGRTFIRSGGTWSTLIDIPVVSVTRWRGGGKALGLVRTVMLLPNGTARLGVAQPPPEA